MTHERRRNRQNFEIASLHYVSIAMTNFVCVSPKNVNRLENLIPTPNSQLPTPNSQLPTPNSQLPTPNLVELLML